MKNAGSTGKTSTGLRVSHTFTVTGDEWRAKVDANHRGELVTVRAEIRLDDECNNGHQDFAITGDIWRGTVKTDAHMMGGGAIGETLAKIRPDYAQFDALHLCNSEGVPMYAIGNGFYWLKEKGAKAAGEYLRLTEEETKQIANAPTEIYLQFLLEEMGVPERWKQEANKAIAQLEDWTGEKFTRQCARETFTALGETTREKVRADIAAGKYTPEKIANDEDEKLRAAVEKNIAQRIAQRDKKIQEEKTDCIVDCFLIRAGINDAIYYTHTNEVVCNWMDGYSRKVTTLEQFTELLKKVDQEREHLPAGITFKLNKNSQPQ